MVCKEWKYAPSLNEISLAISLLSTVFIATIITLKELKDAIENFDKLDGDNFKVDDDLEKANNKLDEEIKKLVKENENKW